MNYVIVETHISEIRAGDTVMHHGEIKTVGNNNMRRGFMGRTLFGDSYQLGTEPVKKLRIISPRPDLTAIAKAKGEQP